MSRLSKIEAKDWDAELQAMTQPDTATALEQGLMRFFAHVPPLAKGLVGFAGALKMHRALPDRLVELVRLRVAFHNQCRSCMAIRYQDALADGLTEDLICSLEKPAEAEGLTAAEQLALRYADLFATNHLAIDDALYEALGEYFTEGEIVELGLQVALFVGVGRLAATWHIVEDLPAAFQDAEASGLTPWGNESVVVR